MQLLHASPVPVPQFASLSLLVREGMAAPLMTVSSTATVSSEAAMEAVRELHCHVRSILRSQETQNDLASELLREDEQSLKTMQIYRPLAANGLGLYYRLLLPQGGETAKLQTLILASNKSAPGKIDASAGVMGVIMCVAVSGSGTVYCGASIPYSLAQRMSDCTGYLQRLGDVVSAKSLLTTFLLTEDEYRITNEMMEAPNVLLLPESDDRAKGVGGGVLSPMGMISPIAEFGRKTARRASTGIVRGVMNASGSGAAANTHDAAPPVDLGFPLQLDLGSADAARVMTERLTVLSVAETGTFLRRYEHSGQERKANLDLMAGNKSRFRRRKAETRDADFDNFDYKGPAKETVKRASKAIPVLQPTPEPAAGKLQLRSSTKDTKRGPGTRRLSTQMGKMDDDSMSHPQQPPLNNSFDHFSQKKKVKHQFDDETHDGTHDSRSYSGNQDASSVLSQARVQVNIALNEDLTCSYKLSQLSSCNVEGVVQVGQIESNRLALNERDATVWRLIHFSPYDRCKLNRPPVPSTFRSRC
jgi:hypothetical protein